MIKKILLVLVSVLVFVSCSNNTTSPDSSNNGNNSGVTPPTVDKEEEELIKKYGIDISQDDAVISQKIEENLKAYFAEKNSYRVILTGTPKDYTQNANESLYTLILKAALKVNTVMNIELDIKNINFQDGSIKAFMFYSFDDKYKNIVISFAFPENKIKTIEKSSFLGLYNTKEITLPDSVITIKESAFMYSSIERVTLGNGLQEIGTFAFMGVDNLKEIIIPDSVKSIGMQAFALSQQLTTLTYLGTNPNNINDKGDVFLGSTKLTTLIVPNAENDKDEGWKTFLGGNFTDIRKN
ncbi:leucine-rich repeat domain-containing protein [Brachyspira intermedia]|uniref:leucine-rich repeat domain-containing protein n=1 Tax=Brachyspira intermedia TaxID=84377 RepID=UPI00300520F9